MWLESYPEGSYADAQGEGGGSLEESVVESGEHTHVWEVLSEIKSNLGEMWTWKMINFEKTIIRNCNTKFLHDTIQLTSAQSRNFTEAVIFATESCQMLC